MEKQVVINEIKRLAAENDGQAPGKESFITATGIRFADWYPKLWLRWSDALKEAGFEPNAFQGKFSDSDIFEKYVSLVRELGRLPVAGELRNRAGRDKDFPSHSVFNRFGGKHAFVEELKSFSLKNSHLEDVVPLCEEFLEGSLSISRKSDETQMTTGFVYLMKSGKHYKIGRTVSVERREREIGLIIPNLPKTVHWIETDDPSGVEAYWHNRFKAKRGKGEWFSLSPSDVAAFKRWKRIV